MQAIIPIVLTIGIDQDPVIYLDFNLSAGASDTVFHIIASSPITPINAIGYATAEAGITDRNRNGASFVPQFDGKAYRASTNLGTFALLLDGMNANARKSASTDDSVDWSNIGTVNSMQAEYWFKLSANDSASGTSTFDLAPVPEPSGLAALAGMLGSLFCVYSKRKK